MFNLLAHAGHDAADMGMTMEEHAHMDASASATDPSSIIMFVILGVAAAIVIPAIVVGLILLSKKNAHRHKKK